MYGSVDKLHDGVFSLYAAWWYDEEDHTTDSEVVKIIMDEEDVCKRFLHWRRSHR